MAKVTYLIGAGASAGERDNNITVQGLPIVKDFPKRLPEIIDFINTMIQRMKNEGGLQQNIQQFNKAKEDLQFLLKGCQKHMSVDTFCKMLFLTDREDDYQKAKYTIILFFELDRYFYKTTDKRYDAFFASILNKQSPRLPDTINVISWNYDCEFERAFLDYCPRITSMEEVYDELNVFHKNSNAKTGLQNKFGILKINGTIGFYDEKKQIKLGLNKWGLFSEGEQHSYRKIIPLIESYCDYTVEKKFNPMISFAWDNDSGALKIEKEIENIAQDSDIIVIIGYSFPYFNKEIDNMFFRRAEIKGRIKVYLQDINAANLEGNVKRLIKRPTSEVHLIENVTQFHIPYEIS